MKFVLISKRKLLGMSAIIFACIIVVSVLMGTNAHAVFYGGNLRRLPIYSVGRDDNKIAISFDCAWGTDYTDNLLDTMYAKGIRSTFFAVKFWVENNPEYVKKIHDKGHEIGTHSSTHPNMSKLSKSAIEKELTESRDAIEGIIGEKISLFRPPFGDYNDLLIQTAESLGLFTIQWDVDSLDWKNLSANEIVQRVTSRVKSGSIILCHNNGLHTHEALPRIIDILQEKGFEFVTVGELIYRENYKMLHDGKQVKM